MVTKEDKSQCTCKGLHGQNPTCPWHGVEAMAEYHKTHPVEYPGDYE